MKTNDLVLIFYVFLVIFEVESQERITIYSSAEKNSLDFNQDVKTKETENKTDSVKKGDRSKLKEPETTKNKLKGHHIKTEPSEILSPYVCPSKNAPKPFFSFPCGTTQNCGFLGRDMLCCQSRCLKGIIPPKTEPRHEPLLFGIIQRKCPENPLAELSDIQECFTDDECSPRICCGETLQNGEKARYCRTPIPVWDTIPLPSPVLEPLKTLTGYMQCTPAPPSYLDLHPKSCQNPLDCFPNLCCQEKGKKYCRPPRKSLLALVADVGQKIIPEDAARKFIERIS
ncbi:uncharacterized protein LOC143201499 isoform X1 [Rhynchophorus ferrugineus]|uniref:uncharacterized protein LOC143201499 isoform X1 n=1 Tax=Rhynchophorus ferrugineus TaxID=354439 RepID=UPI003FCDD1D8